MDKTLLSDKALTLLQGAEKSANGWCIETGETLGGPIYTELCAAFGSHGVQVAMVGGEITITPESAAWAFMEDLRGAKEPAKPRKYEVVIWEQRRIAIQVEAENAEEAEDLAKNVWANSTEEDMENDKTIWVDNQEIKASDVFKFHPETGMATRVLDEEEVDA